MSLPVPIAATRERLSAYLSRCDAGMLRWSIDWATALFLVIIYHTALSNVSGFQRQFSLQDVTLQHPFAQQERVPDDKLFLLSGLLPLLAVSLLSVLSRRPLAQLNRAILGLIFAQAVTGIVTELVKNLVGRPRPDFLDRCQPKTVILPGVPLAYNSTLVDASICSTPTTSMLLRDGFKSFPSGHSSMSFAGLGYLAWCLYGTLSTLTRRWSSQSYRHYAAAPNDESRDLDLEAAAEEQREDAEAPRAMVLTSVVVPFMPLLLATYVALSRVMDYRHHPEDVFAGSLLGAVLASVFYKIYHVQKALY